MTCCLQFLTVCVETGSSGALIITNKLCKPLLSLRTKYNTVNAARCPFRSQGLVKGCSVLGLILLATAVTKEQCWKGTPQDDTPGVALDLEFAFASLSFQCNDWRKYQKPKGDALFK